MTKDDEKSHYRDGFSKDMTKDHKHPERPATENKKGKVSASKETSPSSQGFFPRVDLEFFEGPLDLLLYLIRKNEYDIFDIPIAQITRQYLSYLDIMKELDLEVAGDFLVMAATLMKIKSRTLLPGQDGESEEEGEDPRAALVRQLLEYQKYKEAADQFHESTQLGRDVFARTFENPELAKADNQESAYLDVDVYQLIEALREVLKRLPEKSAHIIRMEPYSVRERMGQLIEMIKGCKSLSFDSLFNDATEKIEVITTFLSLLELVRLQMMKIHQPERSDTIRIIPLFDDEKAEELGNIFMNDEKSSKEEK